MQQQTEPKTRRLRPTAPIFVILFLALTLLAACVSSLIEPDEPVISTQSPTAVAADDPAPVDPTAAPVQQDQSPPEPNSAATPPSAESPAPESVEEVEGAYRLIVVTQLLADSLNQAALEAQSGTHDVLETQVALVIAGVISTGISGARTDLTPPEPMAAYADQAQSINLALDGLAKSWRDRELTPDVVITELEPLMSDLAQLARDAEIAMAERWQMEPAAISQLRQEIIAEVTKIISKLGEDLASPPVPTTPPTT